MITAVLDHCSPNFEPRRAVNGFAGVRHIVLHYTGMVSARAALRRLCDPNAKVSAHYLIDEDGTVFALVDEDQRAWHAGVAYWRGERDINSTSIGIELVNPGHEFGYRPFADVQITALCSVIADITQRYMLPPSAVLGHADVAPGRKQDPGELFPWDVLAADGLCLWPSDKVAAEQMSDKQVWAALSAIGYAVPGGPGGDILDRRTGRADVVAAFQRRYRPTGVDGVLDHETRARIAAVVALYL
jgi:N-acetylmuramoyl-L-alanine amidase